MQYLPFSLNVFRLIMIAVKDEIEFLGGFQFNARSTRKQDKQNKTVQLRRMIESQDLLRQTIETANQPC